jgi:2-dehydro-3-deoxyphosphogluconate aldolase/(4S)-4-hydroxy-2-oxoglutarate aldolase
MSDKQQALRDLFFACRVIPVLTIARVEDAVPLAEALVAGGLAALEITLRTDAAARAARAIVNDVPGAIVGVGTVLNARDLAVAEDIGARFALSPGATPALLDAAAAGALPFAPGVATASEAMAAMERGFHTLKLFPAAQVGGISMARALGGPFPDLRFCPTGGVSAANAAEWLAEPNVIAVGGSWIAPAADIGAGAWDTIAQRARAARALWG